MKSVIFLMGIMISSFTLTQAQRQISGTVTDQQNGTPLSGVTVAEKGGKISTITNESGNFSMNVEPAVNTLIFSYVGYGSKEVTISDSPMNISLSITDKLLNEVVVVGYGTNLKRDITGSITKINSSEVENQPVQSFESALQGKAAGVVIESGSGRVGQGIKIRIRGTSSITASSQPLYVVDGLPIISTSQSDQFNDPTNPIADINPNDIESVEILKDASAAGIYGARAANGVVLITTKKGKLGQKTDIELNISNSFSNPSRKRGFLHAKEYVDLIREAAKNDGTIDFRDSVSGYATEQDAINDYTSFYEGFLDRLSIGTDWRNHAVDVNWEDQQFRKNALSNQVDLSASGGNDKTKFFASGFYNTQEAIVIVNKFYRYGGRLNIEHKATDRLSLGLNMAITRTQLDKVSTDNAFSTPGQLVAQLPISPIYDSTGKLNSNTLYASGLFDAQYDFDKQVTFRSIGNAFANYSILPSLSFRSEFGADIFNLFEESFAGKLSQDGAGVGKGENIVSQNVSYNTNNYFTFTPKLGKLHRLSSVIGMSYLQNDSKRADTRGENFPSDAIKNLTGSTSTTLGVTTGNRYTFLSYFARVNYTFKEKYLFSGSVRTDGSSRFGPDSRYGWFPAASAGWIISHEDFLKNSSFLNFLKLRGSYGVTGNAEIDESKFQSLYSVSNYPNLPGFTPLQLSNPDLKWEKTSQLDVGLEFGLLGNRISGEIDYYRKHTTDLLLKVNIPATTGYSDILKNLGTLYNRGFEVSLNTRNIEGAFKWTTAFNIGFNKNKVTNIQGQIIEGVDGNQRAVEGEPIGVFFLRKFVGVDPQTGDAEYLDKDGKITTNYSDAERRVVGKSNPDYTGGFTNIFSFKGVDLNVFFTFVHGNEIYNSAGVYMSSGFGNGLDNQTRDILNRWQKPGDITNVPRVGISFPTGERNSSRWIYDGSYIRLRNVSLGYNLPKNAIQTLHISAARVYVSGLNLWTSTKYPADPEVDTNTLGNISGGEDFYTIPQPKTITIGLNVKF